MKNREAILKVVKDAFFKNSRSYLHNNYFNKEDQIKELIGKIRAVNDFCISNQNFEANELDSKILEVEEFIKKSNTTKALLCDKAHQFSSDSSIEVLMMIEKHCDDPKLLYNLIIYQLGIEQIVKEIK